MTERTLAKSSSAAAALALVHGLQRRFVDELQRASASLGHPDPFQEHTWLRDEGTHGGGNRLSIGDTAVFDRGSVNVSQVHYDDMPDKRLGSATALSTIIHPKNPHAPSIHMHVSWTEMRDGSGYWRVMADLNPSIVQSASKDAYRATVRDAAGSTWDDGAAQGDRYFTIPALSRTRGVVHFYLERYKTEDDAADTALARGVIEASIDAYCKLLAECVQAHAEPTDEDRRRQLDYHTVYLLQVLTLDRGTTSGLLVHDQNDVGIMGSLPSHVDRELLASWRDKHAPPQDALVDRLVAALPDVSPAPVTEEVKKALAQTVREHYRAHPEALGMQAAGDVIPPTVANHLGPAR